MPTTIDDSDDPLAAAEANFLPDLDNLRYWSDPRARGIMESETRQQGVLWKRRDVFKNSWRPRWFVLQPGQGILTYYLLTEPVRDTAAVSSVFTPNISNPTTDPIVEQIRDRATSWDSVVTENSIDYDVVPRGTIYCLGCTVSDNEALTKPEENLYAFTIRPPNNSSRIHLAARTAQSRAFWMERIARVCGPFPPSISAPMLTATEDATEERPSVSRSTSGEVIAAAPANGTGPENNPSNNRETITDSTSTASTATQQRARAVSWKTLGHSSDVYANLPETLAKRIQDTLKTNLAIADQAPDSTEWKILFRNENSSAFQKRSSRAMIKTVSLLDHPPKQIFNLLVDVKRRSDFESRIREVEILKVLNPHTMLSYYRYDAVWPTSAREWAVVTHWQVIGKGDEKAIVCISFSCPEADALRDVGAGFVRGTLHVNLSLLRHAGNDQCHYTRILSFDLGGGVSSHLSNVIISQQAGLTSILSDLLQRTEPIPDSRFLGHITDDKVLVEDIVLPLQASRGGGMFRRQLDDENTGDRSEDFDALEAKNRRIVEDRVPRLESLVFLLLAPLLLYNVAAIVSAPYPALWFLVCAFFAIREVVLLGTGEVVPWSDGQQLVGPVTCHFHADLKGVLRFIANKKEERQELQTGSAEISVVHILACALATAMKNDESLNVRRISIPWLFLDQFVKRRRSEPVSISISEGEKKLVTLDGVNTCNIQSIADEMALAADRPNHKVKPGSCLILASSNYDRGSMEASVVPEHPDVRVVAVVGGVHLDPLPRGSYGANSHRRGPRPVLSLSITVAHAPHADFISCRRFVEEVRKLIQFPEMCDSY